MINYFDNDYSIPVILGNGITELKAAKLISKETDKEIHVFADKLSPIKRLKYTFHKLPQSKRLLLTTISDFAGSIHEYYTPILIYGASYADFISKNRDELESMYITIPTEEIRKYFEINPKE